MVEEEPKQRVSPPTPVKRKASEEVLLPSKNVRRKLVFDEEVQTQPNRTTFSTDDIVSRELNVLYNNDRRRCIELYNFDPQTGTPMQGRYSWKEVEVNSEICPKVSKRQ